MDRIEHTITIKGLAVSTAMAGALLSGCTTGQAPNADIAAANAAEAMAEGKHDRAIRHAEDAVRADPHNASYRAMLGKAYLDSGRFASAETSFDDAMHLGDNSPRTALSLALSLTAQAKYTEAAALLNDWEGQIAVADLGLALALAGQPERGIHLMTNAIRAGENTVKMRQNLAFAYAVAGRWREARLMASQDVPADQVSSRIEQWAAMASPLAYQQRVAGLLGVPAGVSDHGQPVELALANTPSVDQLGAEAEATAIVAVDPNEELPAVTAQPEPVNIAADGSVKITASAAELPSVGRPVTPVGRYSPPSAQSANDFAQAFSSEASRDAASPAPAPMPQLERETQIVFVSNPVIQKIPGVIHPEDRARELNLAQADVAPRVAGRPVASRSIPSPDAPSSALSSLPNDAGSDHLVQLGSFSSQENAERAWEIYVSRYPELANHDRVITEAVLNGKRYFRVSASGFGPQDSNSMCERVDNSAGDGCISWAASSPLPGAVNSGIQLASR